MVAPRVGAWIETRKPEFPGMMSGVSHPVWVRGLKRDINCLHSCRKLSHPVWVRGLKLSHARTYPATHNVAPRVGAWIETRIVCHIALPPRQVAPRVGAWIETAVWRSLSR